MGPDVRDGGVMDPPRGTLRASEQRRVGDVGGDFGECDERGRALEVAVGHSVGDGVDGFGLGARVAEPSGRQPQRAAGLRPGLCR